MDGRGNRFIVTMMDVYSRYLIAVPVRTTKHPRSVGVCTSLLSLILGHLDQFCQIGGPNLQAWSGNPLLLFLELNQANLPLLSSREFSD